MIICHSSQRKLELAPGSKMLLFEISEDVEWWLPNWVVGG